ncbi:MAG TPA: VOC family protein [Kofleriaceae bacterium]|nr:VOC family protein [Kofleriaceae bacterium]
MAKVKKRAAAPTRKPMAKAKAKTKAKAGAKTTNSAKAKPKPSAMFQKVAFTLFSVDDPARARAFYEDVLGFERGLASPDGVWTEYDLPAGGCLALFKHPVAAMAKPPGGGTIAFEVADLDALDERLKAAGVVYTSDVVHGPNCRMSNILDSEGNAIVLHQLTKKRVKRA